MSDEKEDLIHIVHIEARGQEPHAMKSAAAMAACRARARARTQILPHGPERARGKSEVETGEQADPTGTRASHIYSVPPTRECSVHESPANVGAPRNFPPPSELTAWLEINKELPHHNPRN